MLQERGSGMSDSLPAGSGAETSLDPLTRLGLIARVLTSGSDDEMFDLLVAQAVAAVGADGGMLALVQPDGLLHVVASLGYPARILDALGPFRLTDGYPAAEAVRLRTPVWVTDARERAERYPELALRSTGQVASASFPLEYEENVLGVLGVSYKTEHVFTEDERTFLGAVADHCATLLRLRELTVIGRRADQLSQSNVVGFVRGEDAVIVGANDRFLDMLGYDSSDLRAGVLTWHTLTPEEFRHVDSDFVGRMRTGEQIAPYEKEFVRRDGVRVPVLVAPAMVGERPFRWTSIVVDLSDRRRAEHALEDARALLDAAVSLSPVVFAFLDEDLRFVRVNDVLAGINQRSVEDHVGRSMEEVVKGLPENATASLKQVLAKGEPVRDREVTIRPEGKPSRDWLASFYPVHVKGRMIGVGMAAVEITEHKRQEEARREGDRRAFERRFHEVIDGLIDGVILALPLRDEETGAVVDFRVTYANRASVDIMGRRVRDCIGSNFLELWPNMAGTRVFDALLRTAETRVPSSLEGVSFVADFDGKRLVEVLDIYTMWMEHELLVTGRVVTERVRREEYIREQQRELEEAQRVARLGSWYWDVRTNAVTWSRELYRIYGIPEDTILHALDSLVTMSGQTTPASALGYALEAVASNEALSFEQRVQRGDGDERIVEVRVEGVIDEGTGMLRGMRGTTQDITELRLAQQSLDATTERLAHESTVVEVLQRSLVPMSIPSVRGTTIAGRYTSAAPENLIVGGDWYDVFAFGDGSVGLTIGDVGGHGLPAVQTMVQLRSALRMAVVVTGEPHHAIDQLEAFVDETLPGAYATAIVCVYEPSTGRLRWSRAGHLPFALRRRGGWVEQPLDAGRPPVGTLRRESPVAEVTLNDGDAVLMFTDGLVERRHESIDVGLFRLASALAPVTGPADELCDAAAHACIGSAAAKDDVCLLALQRTLE
jgi:PAS domain S-box-containing protein